MNENSTNEWQSAKPKKFFKQSTFVEKKSFEKKTITSVPAPEPVSKHVTVTTMPIIIDVNENYVPKGIRGPLDDILYDRSSEKSLSTYEKNILIHKAIHAFSSKNKNPTSMRRKLNIYIVHKACKLDNLELLSSIIETEVKENHIDERVYTNAISSSKSGNNILLDAAFYGKRKCMNYLIIHGADLKHINKDGEDIYKILFNGRNFKKSKYPSTSDAIDTIFDECIELVKEVEERMSSEKYTSEVKAVGGAGGECVKSEEVSRFNSMLSSSSSEVKSEKNNFRSDYDFDSLTEDIHTYLEDQSKFKELISFLKKDEKLVELLIKVLDHEDMKDYLIDYPYALKVI